MPGNRHFLRRGETRRNPAFRGGGIIDERQLEYSRFVDLALLTGPTTPPRTLTVRYGLLCERPPLRPHRSPYPRVKSP